MSLSKNEYILKYMENNTKFDIKKFECDTCHQLFIYIVLRDYDAKNKIKCSCCKGKLNEIGTMY